MVLDQGGELYSNPELQDLFKQYNYNIYPTGADSLSQNGPAEQAHHTVSNGIKSCLIGAGLLIAYWLLVVCVSSRPTYSKYSS